MAVKRGYKQSSLHLRSRIDARLATLRNKQRGPGEQWLRERYIGRGLDCTQIAAELRKDPKTIWSWLRHYGIPTRPRGDFSRLLQHGRSPGFKLSDAHKDALRRVRQADGRKPYLKNGVHWLKLPGAVPGNWKGGITPERQAFYATDEWKAACKTVWARAGAKCERCSIHHNTAKSRGTFHVHHIVSFMVRALRAEPSNLALLCASCHRFVHSKRNINREFLPCP